VLLVENYFSLRHFLPELILAAAVFLLAFLDLFEDRDENAHPDSKLNAWFGAAVLLLVAAFSIFFNPSEYVSRFFLFEGLLARDGLARVYRVLMPLLGAAALLLGARRSPVVFRRPLQVSLLLLVVLALQLQAAAAELLAAAVALALVTLTTTVLMSLAGAPSMRRARAFRFLLGDAGASAVTLYGFTWLFGLSGTMDLSAMVDALAWREAPQAALVLALAFVGIGLVLKVGFVLVYELRGAPPASRAYAPLWIAQILAALTLLARVLGGVTAERVLFF
jgi:NADH-quinone oxidoreductase subunit N